MMSEREQIQQEIFDCVNEDEILSFELSPQEEVDMEDRPVPNYDYKNPNHKPPFTNGEDYTEIDASYDSEMNAIAFGKNGYYLKQITEKNGIAYLYHERNTNKIGIWGESRKFDSVIWDIKKRFENATNYLNNKKILNVNVDNVNNNE